MEVLAAALDYDGTNAVHDVLDVEVRQPIASLRSKRIVVPARSHTLTP